MFSGIIAELGVVEYLREAESVSTLRVSAGKMALHSKPGQSISVNGVCLTVIKVEQDLLSFEIISETLKRTNLGLLKSGDRVNLEPALRLEDRLDGHFVTGHIDGTGKIKKIIRGVQDLIMEIGCSSNLLRYIVLKGSVALDGISLTISGLSHNSFQVSLIPYTTKNTTLGSRKEADLVNIEVDILGKYIEGLLIRRQQSTPSKVTTAFLQEHGFTP